MHVLITIITINVINLSASQIMRNLLDMIYLRDIKKVSQACLPKHLLLGINQLSVQSNHNTIYGSIGYNFSLQFHFLFEHVAFLRLQYTGNS